MKSVAALVLFSGVFGEGDSEQRVLFLSAVGILLILEFSVLHLFEFDNHVHFCNSLVDDRAKLQGVEEGVEGASHLDSLESAATKKGKTDLLQQQGPASAVSVASVDLNLLPIFEPVSSFRLPYLFFGFVFLGFGI